MTVVVSPPTACAVQLVNPGEQIFSAKCSRCHGPGGEGSKAHPELLMGELSVAQLAAVISETMPEDDPGALSADESQAVAAYIHDAFYSPIARARMLPARIELARLTVRQHRQAMADLIGTFTRPATWGDERGLTGEYFSSREPKGGDDAKQRRTDPGVDLDFGAAAPVPGIDEPREFSIRWEGAVLAPETGEYEFIIRTEHAARLWINETKAPLIDAWVKSGNDAEYRAGRFLVGGRLYPLKLEFTKAKQGVDDSDKQKDKEQPPSPPASVALLWRRPGGAPEVIPARLLTTEPAPESFVCTTPFPPDDRSYGWERGTSVSAAWDEATTNAAIEAVQYIADRLDKLAETSADAVDREYKLQAFCGAFAERAFRRPLDDGLRRRYVYDQFAAAEDVDLAVRRAVLMVLKSPRFLFREVDGVGRTPADLPGNEVDEVDAFNVAARLSFGLWNSLPDEPLLNAARNGRLTQPPEVREQAERMLGDLRAQAKLQEFLLTWLHLEPGVDLTKDAATFPDFDEAAINDVRASLEIFLDEVLSSPGADYRRLLLDDEVYLNSRLAKMYGVELAESEGFRKLRLDDGHRAGVLTHPYVMARFAYGSESSPIHRGVFLARGVLGRTLRPPPDAFVPLPPDLHPDLTTRERVTLQTQTAECMTCHQIINPLGFALEQFDAVGRYREQDRGKPVDATVEYESPAGETVRLNGARELAEYLTGSEESHAAFVEQLFHHLVQQPVAAYGPQTLERLVKQFAADDYNIRKLAAEIVVATALVRRQTEESAAPPSDQASE